MKPPTVEERMSMITVMKEIQTVIKWRINRDSTKICITETLPQSPILVDRISYDCILSEEITIYFYLLFLQLVLDVCRP